ncbi:MAG TPA: CDP-alcohol phosphatidyltransferase family protein [Dehalococcoidia bacterium]|nr:CDP-alcohol phosphatidyltransferase family protein [Dehalococcoidia bacterium]
MGIYAAKPRFQRALEGPAAALARSRVHPDQITGSALLLSFLGGLALAGSAAEPRLLLLVPLVTVGRTVLNALDGLVARRTGQSRPWGEVLNEVGDRAADLAFFGGVALAPGSDARLAGLVVAVMLLTSYLGTAAKAAGGRRQYGGIMGKADRMIWLGLAAVIAFLCPTWPVWPAFLVGVMSGLVVTFAQRLRGSYVDLESAR